MKPSILPRGRYRIVTRTQPPTVARPRGLCVAPVPSEFWCSPEPEADIWAEYDRKRREGLIHPPSVSTRTEADVERSRRAHGAGRKERSIVGHFPF